MVVWMCAWGNDKSGSDVAVGCLAEALLLSFGDF